MKTEWIIRFIFTSVFVSSLSSSVLAQGTGTLRGRVIDQHGSVIPNATVMATNGRDIEKTTSTLTEGEFIISGVPIGTYTVRAKAPGFAPYENTEVDVTAGRHSELTIRLVVTIAPQEMTISNENPVNTDPENNQSALRLVGRDLETLPEDPDEFMAALQALAGPSGPGVGQIYIDGFTGGRVPPRESIREIRVNENPFSAEVDRVSYGRVEIFTKPGAEKWHAQFFFNFNDESLNARNPFSSNRGPSQIRFFGGNISGPIIKKKASLFVDFESRDFADNGIVNATILDSNLEPVLFSRAFLVPTRRPSLSPRFDYAINQRNTLIARYSFTHNAVDNRGVGDLLIPTRAFDTVYNEHTLHVVETAVLALNLVNETRFQYIHSSYRQEATNRTSTINVTGSFLGGGSDVGLTFFRENRFELQNHTNWLRGKYSLRFGARLRGVQLDDHSEFNFAGTFTFAGRVGVSSLEQYLRRLLGDPDSRFSPNQFTINAGDPRSDISQVDFGAFINNDWSVRPNLMVSFGLRYETQNNIESNLNLAPRVSFAWSPDRGQQPKTVFRGGFGIYYERVPESLSLQQKRFNGTTQVQYVVTDAALLNEPVFTPGGVTGVPSAQQVASLVPNSASVRLLAHDIEAPYTLQSAVSVERQFPLRTTVAFTYLIARSMTQLRTRNVNAPFCRLLCTVDQALIRPILEQGNIYQAESSGRLDFRQFTINFRTRLNPNFSIFGNYRAGFVRSDTDGVGTFPAYSYDLSGEYGNALSDARHFFLLGGSFGLPRGLRVGTYITASSGRPFNITTGFDNNRDSVFTDRPAVATDLGRASVRRTGFGAFDLEPLPEQQIIPRNYGRGPSVVNVNLNITKTFSFGGGQGNADSSSGRGAQRRTPSPSSPGAGGSGASGGRQPNKPYNLALGMQVFNLFNHVNAGAPIGNLSSPRFGESNSLASFGFLNAGGSGGGLNTGSRRITLQVRFSF